MSTLREKFAKKMLDGKLDHLPFNDSMELFKSDEKIENSREWYVINKENFADQEDYDIDEVDYYLNEIIKEFGSIEQAEDYALDIGDDYDHFDEFTLGVCPAPTYMELIR